MENFNLVRKDPMKWNMVDIQADVDVDKMLTWCICDGHLQKDFMAFNEIRTALFTIHWILYSMHRQYKKCQQTVKVLYCWANFINLFSDINLPIMLWPP